MDGRLLNMKRFTNGMISGMTSDEISAEIDKQLLEDTVADVTNNCTEPLLNNELESLFDLTPDMDLANLESKCILHKI